MVSHLDNFQPQSAGKTMKTLLIFLAILFIGCTKEETIIQPTLTLTRIDTVIVPTPVVDLLNGPGFLTTQMILVPSYQWTAADHIYLQDASGKTLAGIIWSRSLAI